jgi:hypothetical protein
MAIGIKPQSLLPRISQIFANYFIIRKKKKFVKICEIRGKIKKPLKNKKLYSGFSK